MKNFIKKAANVLFNIMAILIVGMMSLVLAITTYQLFVLLGLPGMVKQFIAGICMFVVVGFIVIGLGELAALGFRLARAWYLVKRG